MRAAGCLFTSSTLPGKQSFPNVLVENFQLLQTKSKSGETGSGWTILTRTWAWWWRWSPSPATRRRSRSERWSPRTRPTCSWTSVGRRGARAQRGPRIERAARSTTLEPPSAACGRSPSTLRSSAGTGCSSQGESEHTWTCWPGVAGRTRQTSALGVASWEHPQNTLMAPSRRWLSKHRCTASLQPILTSFTWPWPPSDGRTSQHCGSLLLSSQDGSHQYALSWPGCTLHDGQISIISFFRITMWYWASCQVWRCRSAAASSLS